jgi:hypothetical protein
MADLDNPIEQLKYLEARYQIELEEAHIVQCRAGAAATEIERLVQNTVQPMFPEMDKDDLVYTGEWDCEAPDTNPFPSCVYNEMEDPCRDDCLFCHQPAERK